MKKEKPTYEVTGEEFNVVAWRAKRPNAELFLELFQQHPKYFNTALASECQSAAFASAVAAAAEVSNVHLVPLAGAAAGAAAKYRERELEPSD
jgi:hypothetical protein